MWKSLPGACIVLVATTISFAQTPQPSPANSIQGQTPAASPGQPADIDPFSMVPSPLDDLASPLPADPNAPRIVRGPVPLEDSNNLASPGVVAWLSQLIRENLPETYEDTRKWNLQKEVWDGLDVSRDGLQIKTKRKHKLVNHGTWTRYRVQLVEPDKYLGIRFNKLQIIDDGKIAFDVSVEMLLDVFGRMSQWIRDVQLISLSANADAVCKLNVTGTVAFQLNPLTFPPDVSIKPHVDTARVDIAYFRVRRISQVGGNLAEQLGNGLRRALENKLEDSNEKLAEKMNRQLDKHADKMKFSSQEWLQSKLPLPTK